MSNFAEHTAGASVQAFNDLKQAAIAEDWATVDQLLTTKREEIMRPVTVAWASGAGLRDSNPHVRDLAASILEKAAPEKEFGEFGADAMQLIMDVLQNDPNIYVRYRLAFALLPAEKQNAARRSNDGRSRERFRRWRHRAKVPREIASHGGLHHAALLLYCILIDCAMRSTSPSISNDDCSAAQALACGSL